MASLTVARGVVLAAAWALGAVPRANARLRGVNPVFGIADPRPRLLGARVRGLRQRKSVLAILWEL